MLTNLHVKNLALIDEAEVEFGPGLNILTGETGAGKSILIGSINAALGKKISREMIRTGETSALVELVFETENPHVLELLKEMDLEAEEGQVIISRKITGSRSVCRINGEACNISQVKALASLLLGHGKRRGPGAVPGVEECPKGALGVRTRRGGKKAGGSISYV